MEVCWVRFGTWFNSMKRVVRASETELGTEVEQSPVMFSRRRTIA